MPARKRASTRPGAGDDVHPPAAGTRLSKGDEDPPDGLEADEERRFAGYAADPVGFVESVLGQRPWARQAEILRAVAAAPQTTVRSSHGVGKTWMAACSALWWVYSHSPSLVLTTAPTARQVEGVLWAEINRLWYHANARPALGSGLAARGADKDQPVLESREPRAQSLVLPGRCMLTRLAPSRQQTALGLSTNEPEKFAGWHCEHMLVIVDEASGVPDRLFEVIQSTLTAVHCHLLLIGNPTRTEGFFFESHRRPGWKKLKISAYDTPNFATADGSRQTVDGSPAVAGPALTSSDYRLPSADYRLPCPWLVTPEWVEQRRREWGETSDAFRVRVLGEFPRASADTLIELAWVEAAERADGRRQTVDGSEVNSNADRTPSTLSELPSTVCRLPSAPVVFGLDVARFGDCETVLAVRRGEALVALERWCGADLMQTCGRVLAAAWRERPTQIVIDSVGLGAGVVDRLREVQREEGAGRAGAPLAGVRIIAFASGERASDPGKWKSQRDEAYWALRERYREGRIVHQESWSGLTGQLTALHYRFTSRGQLEIESKDELRQRGLPSPDQADAVALAFAPVAAPAVLPVALAARRPVAWPLPRIGS